MCALRSAPAKDISG